MLKNPEPMPSFVAEVLGSKAFSFPVKSRCEAFVAAAASGEVRCLVCTAPASKSGIRSLVVVLLGLANVQRKAFLDRLGELIASTGLNIPKVDLVRAKDATILLAPWTYRGEFRALIAEAVTSFFPATQSDGPVSALSFSSSLPQTQSGTHDMAVGIHVMIDQPALKIALYDFAIAFDPGWRRSLRRMTKFVDAAQWVFPMGCTVAESVTDAGVVWEINFRDVELLERSHGLVDARLDSGKADSLDLCVAEISPEHETVMPAIRIRSVVNSRESRIEMARLLQHVLLFLDRMRFLDEAR